MRCIANGGITMKKYSKCGFDVYHYEFDTLHQFLTQTQAATVNQKIFSLFFSHKISPDNTEWTGTANFEEAVELCQKGWSENFEKFVYMKKHIDEELLSPIIKHRQIQDIIGYNPSVPDYLMGNPLNMWNQTTKQIPTFINIYLNLAYKSETDENSIFNRGVIVLSLVDALQQKGYCVRFKPFVCIEEHNEIIFASFNLKDDWEKLNVKKAYYPLCHPSFLRRLVFLLIETTPVHCVNWEIRYGLPSKFSTFKNIINPGPNDIIITQPSQLGIQGYNIDTDLKYFLMCTNLQKFLTRI